MPQKVSQTTTDHETIRRWAEERGGGPAEVESTAREGETGIIRIDFPGFSGEGKLRKISWDDWFAKFDASGLAFVYEETTAGGQRSNFNKLVSRETAQAREKGGRASARGRARGSARGGARAAGRSGAAARGAGRGPKRAAAAKGGAKRASAKRGGGRRQAGRAEAARSASRRGKKGGAARRGKR
jgi:hypothetical protein